MEVTLNLNEEDLKVLDEALSQLPYFKVVGLINKINEQIHEQDNPDNNSLEEIDNPFYAESNDSGI